MKTAFKSIFLFASITNGEDACDRLCRILPQCPNGSFNNDGFCHGLFFTPGRSGICVNTVLSTVTCPSTWVKVDFAYAVSHVPSATLHEENEYSVSTPLPPRETLITELREFTASGAEWSTFPPRLIYEKLLDDIGQVDTLPTSSVDEIMTKWTRLGGPELLHIASQINMQNTGGVRDAFLWGLLMVGNNIDTNLNSPDVHDRTLLSEFGRASGLTTFCQTHTEPIRNMITNSSGTLSMEAFKSNLDTLCPGLLNTAYLRYLAFYDRLFRKTSANFVLSVSRAGAFDETVSIMKDRNVGVLPSIAITFANEKILGPAPIRNWLKELNSQIFLPKYRLFSQRADAPTTIIPGDDTAELRRNQMEVVGKILGLGLKYGVLTDFNFPVFYYAFILGEELTSIDEIAEDEPMLYSSLADIMEMSGETLEVSEIELLSEKVTIDNRESLINRKINSLVPDSVKTSLGRIGDGFFAVVPESYFTGLIAASDLKKLIYGDPRFSIADLKRHTAVVDWWSGQFTDKEAQWLFDLLDSFDQPMRRKFLRFATGNTRLPVGGTSNQAGGLMIMKGGLGDKLLPTHQTSPDTFVLPAYSTKEILRTQVTLGINAASSEGLR